MSATVHPSVLTRSSRTAGPAGEGGGSGEDALPNGTSPRRALTIDVCVLGGVYAFVMVFIPIAYAVMRVQHPQAWQWGQPLMNVPLAMAGLGLLVVAAVAARLGARWAQRGRRWRPAIAALIACAASIGFVGTVLADYQIKWLYGVRPGARFAPDERYLAHSYGVRLPKRTKRPSAQQAAVTAVPTPTARVVDAANGRKLFIGTCASCHGLHAEGLPGQGKPLVNNTFVQAHDAAGLLAFVKVGRQPWDPENTTHVQMPPRGGNPALSDDDLRDIVAYVRTLQAPDAAAKAQAPGAANGESAGAVGRLSAEEEKALFMAAERSFIPPAATGPRGLSAAYLAELRRPAWMPPRGGEAFVTAYYLVTEFQLVQAALLGIGMFVLSVLAVRGRFGGGYRVAFRAGAIVAGCATVIWLLLFPFVYLI
jgi:mono/diheme cytochrome c family protein/heme/copper-type cytochrome/quinol oxidase subunit 3